MEMVEHRPASATELAQLSSVGARKLDAYGAHFLAVIRTLEAGRVETEVSPADDPRNL
ncbi:MAG: hypothetical protein FD165_2341 [Gammaproteobacteria bacterium]|nr:MAG: hypothetical protein FD165_2341 [Gammaproteobacteria bacterium]TND01440.1 MAG: hypothetical protein FD120_2613 [Gammaproteobacteria bacterium]